MTDSNSVHENIIEQHKKNLLINGELSDFQLENLKKWPLILFDNIEQVAIKYDFQLDEDSKESNALGLCAGIIEFDFKFKKRTRISTSEKNDRLNKSNFVIPGATY